MTKEEKRVTTDETDVTANREERSGKQSNEDNNVSGLPRVENDARNDSAEAQEAKPEVKKRTKRAKKNVPIGQMHIQATFNNTIITFTDSNGNVLVNSSAGACGFRGSKKGTAYAAQIATDKAAEYAKTTFGLTKVDVYVKGVGLGRDSAIRSILNHSMIINSITDVTGIPHGGVRPKRQRRA